MPENEYHRVKGVMEKDFDDRKYQVQMMTGWRTFACFTIAKELALLVTKFCKIFRRQKIPSEKDERRAKLNRISAH